MKIAYVATTQIPSTRANSIQVMKVCQALISNGDSVLLYVPGNEGVNWEELASHYGITERFPVTCLLARPFLRKLDFAIGSLKEARREQVEVVYTRMLWVAWMARWFDLPVILELHDLPSGRIGPLLYKSFLRSSVRKLVVYITRALKRLTDKACRIQAREGDWTIAPDGVDLARYLALPEPHQARAALGLTERITAAYSGGFYKGRGLETLLELAKSFPGVQFLWIGGTSEQVQFWERKLIAGGIQNVVLTGFVANNRLPLYQAAAEILLMPYEKQFSGSGGGNIAAVSSPMKMFEYMATGRAILASNIPVLGEVLNVTNAMFYKAEDFEDLKHQFDSIIADQIKRKILGTKAREDVNQYEWKTRMKMIMQVFNR